MFFNGRKDILEDDDFVSLHQLDLSTEGGRQYVTIKLLMNGQRKVYGPNEHPSLLCLSDGVSQRLLPVQPMPAPLPADQEPQPVADVEAEQAKTVAAEHVREQAEAQAEFAAERAERQQEVASELAKAVSAVQASLSAIPAPSIAPAPSEPEAPAPEAPAPEAPAPEAPAPEAPAAPASPFAGSGGESVGISKGE